MAQLIDKLNLMVNSKGLQHPKANLVTAAKKRTIEESSDDYPLTSKKRAVLEDLTNASQDTLLKWHNLKKQQTNKNNVEQVQQQNEVKDHESDLGRIKTNIHEFLKCDEDDVVNGKSSCNENEESKISTAHLSTILSEEVQRVLTLPNDVADIDEADLTDPFRVADYAPIIFENMKQREAQLVVNDYLERQNDITEQMRMILIDWLCEVQQNFELFHETLYLAVKIVDRFLSARVVSRDALQLIGATAMLMSSKIEERYPPLVDDFVYICDDAYSRQAVLDMERDICYALDFDLNIPIPYRFLRRYGKVASLSMENLTLARYILELTLQEYQFVTFKPSMLAAGCLCLALKMKNCGEWTQTLVHYSGYEESELNELVQKLNAMIAKPAPENCKVVKTKYSHTVFYQVANIAPLQLETDV
ncbi:G2/mitotic-specific cyclin-B3 [Trichoplax sp. H2]|nr:G2/mitotic-specific cyclin-B3 [Trichoplax sp. H2]|eukprot:RDD40484.1 G2/mitotic-specific cyclin-B3 [Trichoplax sp. H2]